MNAETLFLAIGGVESSRLARSEQSSRNENLEDNDMKHTRKLIRSLMLAAAIAAVLATTAFAAAGFLLFGSPMEMIDTLFGNHTGYDTADWSVPDYKGDVAAEFHSDRAPVNEEVAETMEPLVQPMGQSITWKGNTLTVDANLYDASTRCGFLTYTIENPNGLHPYETEPNGEVWFPDGELLVSNQYGRSYIIQEKSSDTTLCATYYYQTRNPKTTDLELWFTIWASVEDMAEYRRLPMQTQLEMKLEESEEKITIPAADSTLPSVTFGDGAVTLTPIAVQVTAENTDVRSLIIVFQDGTTYTVVDDTTINYLFHVGDTEYTENTLMLNRLVDVSAVASVTVNGVVYQ